MDLVKYPKLTQFLFNIDINNDGYIQKDELIRLTGKQNLSMYDILTNVDTAKIGNIAVGDIAVDTAKFDDTSRPLDEFIAEHKGGTTILTGENSQKSMVLILGLGLALAP